MREHKLSKLTRNILHSALVLALLASWGCAGSPTAPLMGFEDLNAADANAPVHKLSDDEFDQLWHGDGSSVTPLTAVDARAPREDEGVKLDAEIDIQRIK